MSHLWKGKIMPSRLANIKDWQIECGDVLEERLVELFRDIAKDVYGNEHTIPDYELLLNAAKTVCPSIIHAARENDIPVWDPDAVSDEF